MAGRRRRAYIIVRTLILGIVASGRIPPASGLKGGEKMNTTNHAVFALATFAAPERRREMSTTTHRAGSTGLRSILRHIGRAARTAARNYAAARQIEARRLAFRGMDEYALRDIGVDRFGLPYRAPPVAAPPKAPPTEHDATPRPPPRA